MSDGTTYAKGLRRRPPLAKLAYNVGELAIRKGAVDEEVVDGLHRLVGNLNKEFPEFGLELKNMPQNWNISEKENASNEAALRIALIIAVATYFYEQYRENEKSQGLEERDKVSEEEKKLLALMGSFHLSLVFLKVKPEESPTTVQAFADFDEKGSFLKKMSLDCDSAAFVFSLFARTVHPEASTKLYVVDPSQTTGVYGHSLLLVSIGEKHFLVEPTSMIPGEGSIAYSSSFTGITFSVLQQLGGKNLLGGIPNLIAAYINNRPLLRGSYTITTPSNENEDLKKMFSKKYKQVGIRSVGERIGEFEILPVGYPAEYFGRYIASRSQSSSKS